MSEDSPSRAGLAARLVGPLLFLAAVVAAYWDLWTWDPAARLHQFSSEAETWFFSAQATSPPLVFALAAWLLWRRRQRLEASWRGPGSPGPALAVLAAGAGLAVWAHLVSAPHLLVPSLSLVLVGTALWCGGPGGARAVALPAGFLLFACPLPAVLVNQTVFPLQLWTGQVAASVADALGRSNTLYGDLIATDQDLFQVIETCSGLRTIMTLGMAAFLYGEGFGKRPRRTALLVAASPFLALAVNVVRVVSIVMNPLSRFAEVHTIQGMVTVFGGVLLLGLFDAAVSWLWGDGVARPGPAAPAPPAPGLRAAGRFGQPAGLGAARRFALPTGLLAAVATLGLALPAWKLPENEQPPLWKLPRQLPSSRDLKVERDFLGSVGFTHRFLRRFEHDGGQIDLFVALDVRTDGRFSLLSPKTMFPDSGLLVREHRSIALGPEDRRADAAILDGERESLLVYHWRVGFDSPWVEGIRGWLELGRSPWHDETRAAVVRLATPIARKPSGVDRAEARLRSFLDEVGPTLTAFELL